ncbi:trafficking protein particle complex subunit 12-like [Stegodyphus dumicola]|uniref:trafficking protein particle complex subunit 12-like n=1 Tax=Stegodyphus dumicola TaxID=202533 RepID=UPI0015AD13FE|nr:trafficking protein particle complex subunit 12-like [Stegodyphus dumicola]XP_035212658.1 trafficking protein particle complex subunit 12-like [Stegodyphus dumicola]
METPGDEVPELAVETENVRRNSASATAELKSLQPSSLDLSIENANKCSIVHPKPCSTTSEIKNIKRVDSDSKFGVLETIPLELSGQEASPRSGSPNLEKSENLTLQLRSLSMNDGNIQSDVHKMSFQRPHSATECEQNTLSKYFRVNPVPATKIDSEGVEFFNALAESAQGTVAVKSETSGTAEGSSNFGQNKTADVEKKTEIAEEAFEDSIKKEPPPVLLKFFAEDKSGSDRDGKAFFDKIAEEKLPKGPATVELHKEILPDNSSQNQFLASPVCNGEIEEAWIPSERTRHTLVSVNTSSSFVPDKNLLTMPGIIIDEEMEDPVKALLIECNSPEAQKRKVLTVSDVTEDEIGLQKLMEAECYHAAINLTKRLLKSCNQGPGDEGKPSKHTPYTLRLWYTRLALMVKLRKFSYAEVESAAFGDLDKPDLYYEYYPDLFKGKRGTMVPFSFRILLAELPQYQGNHQIALDNMHRILNVIQKMLKNVQSGCAEDGSMIKLPESRQKASLEIWSKRERRVLYSILNCVLSQKDYILAVSVIKILMEKSQEHAPELHSALGRIYLQLGDVKYAQECFTKAGKLSEDIPEKFRVEEKINKALLAIAFNNSEEAYKYYQEAYSISPGNAMLANNMAVCLLYMGRLKESLNLLEKTIRSSPSSCLHDGILFNICTLYELESSRCTQKKLAMLELVSKYAGDAFNITCLKIQPVVKA